VAVALDTSAAAPFKGDLDVAGLEDFLDVRRPPLVLMTLTSNSTGGQPASLENMKAVHRLCAAHGVPLFIDAARFAENAWLARERDPRLASLSPAAVALAFFDLADGCVMSAKKDGLVHMGGFIALRDRAVAERIRRSMVVTEGFPTYGGLAGRDLDAIAIGLTEVLTVAYGGSQVRDLVVYGFMIVILLLRPQGLLGARKADAGRV